MGPDSNRLRRSELVGWLTSEIEGMADRASTEAELRELAFKRILVDTCVRYADSANSSSVGLARELLTLLGDLLLALRRSRFDDAVRLDEPEEPD